MAPAMRVEARQHARAHIFFGAGFATTRGMGVEQISLELFDLSGSKRDFRKLTDAGVDSVHDFTSDDLSLEKAAALVDARHRIRVQQDGLAMAGDRGDILNLQRMPVQ